MSWIAPGTGARRESLNGTFDLGRPHGCPKPGVAQVMPAMPGGVAHSGRVIFAAAGVMVVRLRRVADTCPVRRALEAGFQFEERIVTPDGADLATAA